MDEFESLNDGKRECKYHVMFIPKCRRRTLCARVREHLGKEFRWVRGHVVSTVGRNEAMIREYICNQEKIA